MVILYVIIYLIKDKQYLKNGKMNNIIIHKDMIMEKQEQCNMLMMEKYLIKMIIMIQILKIIMVILQHKDFVINKQQFHNNGQMNIYLVDKQNKIKKIFIIVFKNQHK